VVTLVTFSVNQGVPNMRDIRSDLKERLEVIAKMREELEAKLDEVDEAESGVKALLQQEEQRFGGSKISNLILTPPVHDRSESSGFVRTPLSNLIFETLKNSNRALALDDFKKHAETSGFDFGAKSPGRTLHWALIGLTENGYLECTGKQKERRYRLKEAPETTRAEAVQ
jgi:hypothetical protein